MASSDTFCDVDAERIRVKKLVSYFGPLGIVPKHSFDPQHDAVTKCPVLATDGTLTALTQLAPLRLDCDRAFVSLIDRNYRYIIAESTRSLSYYEGPGNSRDSVYLGVVALDIAQRVLPNAIHAFTDLTGQYAVCTPNVQADRSKFRICSLQDDKNYSDRPYVRGWPHMRTYLEVPLRAATGEVLGSYCVVDNRLRNDWNDDTAIHIMHDIARVIMDHLDLIKMKDQHKRAERLVNNLCIYVEEKIAPNSSEYGVKTDDDSPGDLSEGSSRSSSKFDPTSARSAIFSSSGDSSATQLTVSSPIPRPDPFELALEPVLNTKAEEPQYIKGVLNSRLAECRSIESASYVKPEIPPEVAEPSLSTSGQAQSTSEPGNVSSTFSRAARLIQEATDVEGILFLDASPKGFATRLNPRGCIGGIEKSHYSSSWQSYQARNSVNMCEILGKAVKGEPTKAEMVPEPLLQDLLQAYPKGAIFFIDRLEELESNSADLQCLFQAFAPAHFILFMPLWDYFKEGWHAATIGWSSKPHPLFASEDLIYITAFGNSIMAEVSRLEAANIGYAKSSFISSISHELRSPLHGILASAELLGQTNLDRNSSEMVEMIKMCGTTLLETMDHLLDFAQINHLTRMSPRISSDSLTPSRERSRDRKEDLSLSKTVDLSILVQEVVECSYLGYFAQTKSNLENLETFPCTAEPGPEYFPKQNTLVCIMDIRNNSDWLIHTESGAWRRLVLNLVGNALKYTESGVIEISLELLHASSTAGSLPTDNPDYETRQVCFSVKDTGRGIGSNYLKHRIFTPYAQENSLATGMGLGLSIVKHLVTSLGGEIDIQSEVGVGTEVRVVVPVLTSTGSPSTGEPASLTQSLRGKKIAVMTIPGLPEPDGNDENLLANALSTANHWWGLEVIQRSDSADTNLADFYVLLASQFEASQTDRYLGGFGCAAFLVLCIAPPTTKQIQAAASCDVIFLQQPFGPKKLKASLEAALLFRTHKSQNNPPTAPMTPSSNWESPPRYSMVIQEPPVSTSPRTHPQHARMLDINTTTTTTAKTPIAPSILTSATTLEFVPSPYSIHHPLFRSPPSFSSPTNTIAISPPSHEHDQQSSHSIYDPPLHILLVDDNSINLRLLSAYVRSLGCTFATASNGLEAFEMFKEAATASSDAKERENDSVRKKNRGFDVVLMDVNMPVMNGFEAARAIRGWELERWQSAGTKQGKEKSSFGVEKGGGIDTIAGCTQINTTTRGPERCRILALTGLGSADSQREAFSSGMDEFLMKPVPLKRVKAVLYGKEAETRVRIEK